VSDEAGVWPVQKILAWTVES